MNNYDIHCKNPDDPYGSSIVEFIKREFPHLVKRHDDPSRLNLVTDAIMATGQVRFGPLPEPEQMVAIRKVVSDAFVHDEPIPFLVGWGSEKPNGSGVDIAELFALKTLSALQARVKDFYLPGIVVNIRVEDVSAPHLFFERMEAARKDAFRYTQGFVKLIQALDFDHWLHAIPESTLISETAFNQAADKILPIMELHLAEPNDEAVKSALSGFSVSKETTDYFMQRYERLYPEKTLGQRRHILARYFTAAAARRVLHLTGQSEKWNDFLELAFVQPTPGIAASRRRIYYRTMPSSITSNHMPAWRAKGFLKITNDNLVKASLTTFDTKEYGEFNDNVITISNGIVEQDVQADYIIL